MLLGNFGCRPDLLGWRRARSPHLPVPNARGLVTLVPDWICEVLSTSTAAYDIGDKRAAYHRAGVAHYWIADPVNHTIAVFAHRPDGYLLVASAGRGERVALPPFDAVAIVLDDVFDPDATAPG